MRDEYDFSKALKIRTLIKQTLITLKNYLLS